MEAKFLRKIILEELKKVLNEQTGGTSKEGPYSTMFGGPLGPEQTSKVGPKPGDREFMGPEQPTPIPGGVSVIKPDKKRLAVKKLQKNLADYGFLTKSDIDGIPGPKTLEAVNAALDLGLTLNDMKKLPPSDFDLLVQDLITRSPKEMAAALADFRTKSLGITTATPTGEKAPTPPSGPDLPKSPADVNVPFTPKSEMDKMIGPKKGFTTDPNVTKDTGPKKQDDELKQEALVRAISKLLKKL